MLTPNDVIMIYAIVAPLILGCLLLYVMFNMRPQVNVSFPKILLCGCVDSKGTTIDIPNNGALILAGRKLRPGTQVYLIEVST